MLHRCHVATGQGPGYYRREGQPHIRVWNSVSLQTVAVLGMTITISLTAHNFIIWLWLMPRIDE